MTSTDISELAKSFTRYTVDIAGNVALAVVLGILVNISSDYIGKLCKLSRIGILIVQFVLICIVFYIMRIDSKYLYYSEDESGLGKDYGIIFTAVFLAVQANVVNFFEDIYLEGKNKIGIGI